MTHTRQRRHIRSNPNAFCASRDGGPGLPYKRSRWSRFEPQGCCCVRGEGARMAHGVCPRLTEDSVRVGALDCH
eukprot:1919607-Prymnesium_polylepis.1